jgi:hypothetical protein
MSVVDDVRKLLQDFIAPELSAIKESIGAYGQIADARWQAEQAQYATLQTNMELIKQQMKNNQDVTRENLELMRQEMRLNHDTVMEKLNVLAAAKEGATA